LELELPRLLADCVPLSDVTGICSRSFKRACMALGVEQRLITRQHPLGWV